MGFDKYFQDKNQKLKFLIILLYSYLVWLLINRKLFYFVLFKYSHIGSV